MLQNILVNKSENRIYAIDEDGNVIKYYEMSKDFWPGENESGQSYCNAENGEYDLTGQEIDADGPYKGDGSRDLEKDVMPFGWAYINLDERGHAIHCGGSNLGWPGSDDPEQELTKTNGCFRMHNKDGFELAKLAVKARNSGIKLIATVEG